MQAAMDFDYRDGFRKLVARCPILSSEDRVVSLVSLERCGTDNALQVIQELLLRPNLTVVVAGCFRPMLSEVVSGLVHSMQLLRCNNASGVSQRNLTSHEYASMAFSRILELAPFLLSSILQYFAFAPPAFERLFHDGYDAAGPPLLEVLRASYRFLQLEPKTFRELWDWSPFLDLLQWTGLGTTDLVSDVRWSAIQVLSVVFRMSDAATRDLSSSISKLSEEEAFSCLIRWEEFSQEIAVEKAGMFIEYGSCPAVEGSNDRVTQFTVDYQSVVKWKQQQGGKISHLLICGIELPFRQDCAGSHHLSRSSFVVTPSMKSHVEAVALALSQRQPVLLEGPLGSGKSSLIRELARLTGNSDVLFIHLDDQMDTKMLLGNYVCTEIPGEFKWQPGALTQALARGLWVVFEDIDKAPSEMFSSLVSLLEDRKLQIPGRGETIHAAESFRLFATISRMKFGSAWKPGEGRESFSYLWRKVVIDTPSDEELSLIVKERFPGLASLIPKLIGTLSIVKDVASQSSAHVNPHGGVFIHIGRQFSMRDLLKFCKRVAGLLSEAESWKLVDSVRDQIYLEAVDCFVASISNLADRQLVMRAIAEQWDVPMQRVDYYASLFKPGYQELPSALQIGRVLLPTQARKVKDYGNRVFANTGHTMRKIEQIARCVEQQEPVLLVGETGTGKTTLVQRLAWQLSIPLTVVNLSQQTDAADFLGGFKPVEAQSVCLPLLETFNRLFAATFSLQKNKDFWETVHQCAEKKKWVQLLKSFRLAVAKVAKLGYTVGRKPGGECAEKQSKRQKPISQNLLDKWCAFSIELNKTAKQVEASKSAFAFSFVEGALVKALRNGSWLLLDEINLAPVEILERLNGVFDGEGGSICLTERGDMEAIDRHPNFRIFACMNPATDVGKQDLPVLLRNRLTEFYIDEMGSREDLEMLVFKYLEGAMPAPPVQDIVDFYLKAREEAEKRLLDGAGHKPQYSLRSLSRALEFTRIALPTYGFHRALYDGICMSFVTLLDHSSVLIMEQLIETVLFKKGGKSLSFSKLLLKAPAQPSLNHVLFEQFWVERGTENQSEANLEFCKRYVLTKSIREHLKNLARAVFTRKYPVLLQGPTSSGKTSLVQYLAVITGHRFVRINNHEHTDLQEYLGCYVTDHTGKLVFQEGLLVEAVRKGYWVVLDELNLAPSDVLEALNRLLDDNRELFVPELQVTVKPHPHFMLFATQNPPGIYGGRKALSRAFRNRFIELHVDDIPDEELCTILEKRCELPASYAGKMVEVLKDLQRHRQGSKVFAGKHGFITPRDLFRWAERHRKSGISYDDLAWSGYILLAERIRDVNEKMVVQMALEKHMRVKLNLEKIYELLGFSSLQQRLREPSLSAAFGRIVWTKSMRRLFHLVEQCHEHNEPILLVGETGCGKTTVCQLLAMALGQKLHILNCHQHTETSDFLGGFRPVRGRENIALKYRDAVLKLSAMDQFDNAKTDLSPRIEDAGTTLAIIRAMGKSQENVEEMTFLESVEKELQLLQKEWQSLFIWHDGPLVNAMRNGDLLLVDEISLAEDSVLERLNSVLEPKGCLVLAEKGGSHVEELFAHPKFRLMATMNPGGDFGKKELSPALRNRFTEVWVPAICDLDDLRSIILERLRQPSFDCLVDPLLQFWQWFQQRQVIGKVLSMRDLFSWINYINTAAVEIGKYAAFVHGAFLVLFDGLGLGSGLSNEGAHDLKSKCAEYLQKLLPEDGKAEALEACSLDNRSYFSSRVDEGSMGTDVASTAKFGIYPFYISKGCHVVQNARFEFRAPTTSRNVMRILRAMQLPKPILLEGSPGVGKTSLVSALAAFSGHSIVRINLSEQTDIMDLFGSDLPVEGGKAGEFHWSDGVFLQALKAGNWVLLDELNLASQSVLEGLNSCLDHRGEVFIPELGLVFKCPSSFRVFACQNPLHEGGGRKGLPKSFLNRFTKVYVEPLSSDDYSFIARALHPAIPEAFLLKIIQFNSELYHEIMIMRAYGHAGAPWEFNLRDILRWCSLIEGTQGGSLCSRDEVLAHLLNVVYLQRLRTKEDRNAAADLFRRTFGIVTPDLSYPNVSISESNVVIGLANLERLNHDRARRDTFKHVQLLPGFGSILESVMHCIQNGWMALLVGPPKSGKTSVVRLLADLTGNTLHEYSLSGATDTTELLGCYEQHDIFRCWREALTVANDSAEAICSFYLSLTFLDVPPERKISVVKSILASWSTLKKAQSIQSGLGLSDEVGNLSASALLVDLLSKLLEQLESVLSLTNTSLEFGLGKLRRFLSVLTNSVGRKGDTGRFEWIDGDLLRAVEHGGWVLLENANLCNPTVLDRLNPLLEPGGRLMINERGLVNGQAMVVQAHPNFRLFLTLDPSNGEVSRAMRNRGVEIYMMPPHTAEEAQSEASPLYQDTKTIVRSSGIPGLQLIDSMCKAHLHVKSLMEKSHSSTITFRELCQWISLFHILVERGAEFHWSIVYSWEQSYLPCIVDVELRLAAKNTFESCVRGLELGYDSSVYVPGGWPYPLVLRDYCLRSREAVVRRDCGYIDCLSSKLLTHEILDQSRAALKSQSGSREFLKWLESMNSLAAHFPQKLLHFAHNPRDNLELPVLEYKSTDIERRLCYAIFWMLEQAPLLDLELRVQWLRIFLGRLGNNASKVQTVLTVLQLEKQHPVLAELKSAWDQLRGTTGLKGRSQLSIASQSCILNSARFSADIGDGADSAWRRIIALVSKLSSLRRSLLQWQTEDNYLRSSTSNLSRSPILQSYWHHMQPGGEAIDVCGKMFIWLYPVLLSLRKMENEVLLSTAIEWSDSREFSYLEQIEGHETFWRVIQDPSVDAEFLQYSWNRVKCSMSQLGDEAKLQHVLGDVLQLMDAALSVEGCSAVKPYLWKFGGHPQLPHSLEYLDIEQRLLDVCQTLWQEGEAKTLKFETLVLRFDSSIWRMLLEGFSIISCMGQLSRTCGDAISVGIQVPEEMLKMVLNKVNSEKLKLQKPISCQLIPVASVVMDSREANLQVFCSQGCGTLQTFPKELFRWLSGRDLWIETRPWLDHLTLLLDGALITDVLPSVATFTFNDDSSPLIKKLRTREKAFQHALSFSMNASSRSPAGFVPHQHILWILDADPSSLSAVAASIRDKTHELMFQWHVAIWDVTDKPLQNASARWEATSGACRLFQAAETVFVSDLITRPVQAKDYNAKVCQLSTLLGQAWLSSRQNIGDAVGLDLCRSSAALQQILCAHKKLFLKMDAIYSIMSALHSQVLEGNVEDSIKPLEELSILLKHSQHPEIVNVIHDLILPCSRLLYLTSWNQSSYHDVLSKLGQVWLLIGKMRAELLLVGYGSDPMAKYIYKHRHLLDKIEDISIEIEVRKESNRVVKGGGTAADVTILSSKREKLKAELHRIESKVVPRPTPPQFRAFCEEVVHFMQSTGSSTRLNMFIDALAGGISQSESSKVIEELAAWQGNATNFIRQLSFRFRLYRDVVQPTQMSIYELKYGLSLMLGGYFGRDVFGRDNDSLNLNMTTNLVCSLMRFPSSPSFEVNARNEGFETHLHMHTASELATSTVEKIIEKAVSIRSVNTDIMVNQLELKVSVLRTAITRLTHGFINSRHFHKEYVKLLGGILNSIVNIWKQIRLIRKAREEESDQQIRFSSSIQMEKNAEQDEASFKELFPSYWSLEASDGSSVEMDFGYDLQKLVSGEEFNSSKINQVPEGRLASFQEDMLRDVVDMYNRIFIVHENNEAVADKDLSKAFILGYDSGRALIEGLSYSMPKEVDNLCFSAHMLRLGLDHLKLSSADNYGLNIYKDSNPSELCRMLDPLAALLQRIGSLLEEWPEHPVLLQVVQFTESLISIPISSPIMKALMGLELVLAKAQLWEQNAPKHLSLTAELTRVSQLVMRWRKMELQSWPALLQDVNHRHEVNAEQLWFSFYDVLHQGEGLKVDMIIESSEELLLSAPLGEFQSRLKLILGFYGEFHVHSQLAPSVIYTRLSSILYNMYHYYSRFLPLVEDTLASGRSPIENELRDFVRLCKWEDYSFYSVVSTAERTHRKLHKLIRKYDDFLKRPTMEILKQRNLELRPLNQRIGKDEQVQVSIGDTVGVVSRGREQGTRSSNPHQRCAANEENVNSVVNDNVDNMTTIMQPLIEEKWATFCANTVPSMVALPAEGVQGFERKLSTTASKMAKLIACHVFSKHVCETRQTGAATLDALATAVITRSAELREENKNRAVKKKALIDLRRSFKELGLSHHKSDIPKDMRGSVSWFQEPFTGLHSLLHSVEIKSGKQAQVHDVDEIEALLMQNTVRTWERAQGYYFDNISLLQQLYRSSLNYNKDLSLTEVETFTRYMEHLLYLQQKHRRKIQEFSSSLSAVFNLTRQFGVGEVQPQQAFLRKIMWQQKSLFDHLCQLSAEVRLFLKTFERVEGCALRQEASTLSINLKAHFDKMRSCKGRLDELLVPHNMMDVSDNLEACCPLLITEEMFTVVKDNFNLVQEMEDFISKIIMENSVADGGGNYVLMSLKDLLHKGVKLSQMFNAIEQPLQLAENSEQALARITAHYEEVIWEIRLAGQRLQGCRSQETSRSLEGDQECLYKNVQDFEGMLEEATMALRLDRIYKSSINAITHVVSILDQGRDESGVIRSSFVSFLRFLSVLLEMLEAAGLQILFDYINLHKAVAKLGYVVSNVLIHLYRDGFCGAREEVEAETSKPQDAEGTGMGEGEGTKDVSEQIEEEDQLLGSSEKEAPPSNEEQNKLDKGIEMEQEFSGDMFDISEDDSQEDDNNQDDEDEKLDSKMADHDENSEIVDEKMWDKEDEGNEDQQGFEKFEQGAPISARGSDDLELRAKTNEDAGEEEAKNSEQENNPENKSKSPEAANGSDETENKNENTVMNQEDAFEDSSGLKPPSDQTELMNDSDLKEEMPSTAEDHLTDQEQSEMDTDAIEDALPEEMDIVENEGEMVENVEEELDKSSDKDEDRQGTSEDIPRELASEKSSEGHELSLGEMDDPKTDLQEPAVDALDDESMHPNVHNQNPMAYGLATNSKGDPLSNDNDNSSRQQAQASVAGNEQEQAPDAGPSNGDDYISSASLPLMEQENNFDRLDANPYRSLGDALKKWKQRARMIQDQQENLAGKIAEIDLHEEDHNEAYKYVSTGEQSTAQTLGAATDDQMKQSDDLNNHESEDVGAEEPMSIDYPSSIKEPEPSSTVQTNLSDRKKQSNRKPSDELVDRSEDEGVLPSASAYEDGSSAGANDESLVSLRKFDPEAGGEQSAEWNNEVKMIRKELEIELKAGTSDLENARKLWQKYEQLTGRLSQDLAEQLRLILEPTLAARLQGDYKSGKRLNMKKIIPFVASEFRKDKIWLRRTKANKRQYQVVLAIDDSRSMSESHCGHMALEALITICRGMTHLEVGQMAVASFGKKGNVRLLHNFDQPFSSEAGVKMISEFSFAQDNTISDEPMVDLLQSLTRMLDSVAARYSPSGGKELQQLVLIIADGRFHEKESLRRCVRDALSRKQLLAFLVLDNPQESLLDMQSVSFSGGAPSFSKYLDSFPFPYYILLKDIEALPQTLADLLRQWFELMQHTATR